MIKIEMLFQEELLATKPDNLEIFKQFVESKKPKADVVFPTTPVRNDEIEAAELIEETGTSVFHKHEGIVCIYDYQIKGFFKDACGSFNRMDAEFRGGLDKLSAYKSKIDGCVFVYPRLIPLLLPQGATIGTCERPMRSTGPQGERVALVSSESAPAGTKIQIEIEVMMKDLARYIQVWLDYGKRRGLGQWRNSGKGRFSWAQLDG
jgi:hypothetical protein